MSRKNSLGSGAPQVERDPFVEERKPEHNYTPVSKYTVKKLNVRMNITKEPNPYSEVVINLPAGSIVEVESFGKEWSKVKNGFVMTTFLSDC